MKIQVSISDPMGRNWVWSDLRRDWKTIKTRGSFFLFFVPSPILHTQAPVPKPHPLPLYTYRDICVCFSLWFCFVLFLSCWPSLFLWVHMAKYSSPDPIFHVFSSRDQMGTGGFTESQF